MHVHVYIFLPTNKTTTHRTLLVVNTIDELFIRNLSIFIPNLGFFARTLDFANVSDDRLVVVMNVEKQGEKRLYKRR